MINANIYSRQASGRAGVPPVISVILFSVFAVASLAGSVGAQPAEAELYVQINDTVSAAGDTGACLLVYMGNYQDTLAGFSLRILLNRPDLIEFPTDKADTVIDTIEYRCVAWDNLVCVDSVPVDPPRIDTFVVSAAIDTTGSVLSNWEFVYAVSLSPGRHDLKIVGFAENDLHPPYMPGIAPGEYPRLLCRLPVRVYDPLPSVEDSTVELLIVDALSETNFSDPNGRLIGTITNYNICDTSYCETWDYVNDICESGLVDDPPPVYDTMLVDTFYRYWECLEWGQGSQGEDSCLEWLSSTDDYWEPTADSISIDSLPWTIWNDDAVTFLDGSLTVMNLTCGDANRDETVNISDAVYIINYIFKGGPEPYLLCVADANGDGQCNIADAVYLVAFIFQGGPPPVEDCC